MPGDTPGTSDTPWAGDASVPVEAAAAKQAVTRKRRSAACAARERIQSWAQGWGAGGEARAGPEEWEEWEKWEEQRRG